MNKLIKILKDTPFHKANTELPIAHFRAIYGYICSNKTTDEELIRYLEKEWQCRNKQSLDFQNQIGDWFQVIEKFELEPLVFVHEDLWYVKDFDGMYAVFVSPMFYKEYLEHNKTASACVKRITIPEARKLISESKYKKQIMYCTNDVNKKM